MATTTRDVNAADYRAEAERLRQRAHTVTDIIVQSRFLAQADRCEELAVAVEVKPAGSPIHIGSPDLRDITAPYYFAAWSLALAVLLLMTEVLMIYRREDAGPALTARGLAMLVLVLVLAVGLISCGSPASSTSSGNGGGGGGSNSVTTQFTLQGRSGTATLNLSTMSITVP